MTNHTDLINKLRDIASKGVSVWGDLQMEAADALEAAQAEIDMHMRVATNAIDHVVTLKAEIERLKEEITGLHEDAAGASL